jgi:Carboxypeptidase regulatory-like domain/TonB-dependent Receptor Plug Domain
VDRVLCCASYAGENHIDHMKPARSKVSCPLLLLLTAILIVCSAHVTSGQDTVTGAFLGTVTDRLTGDPIQGAAVEILNEQTGLSIRKTTDSEGRFYQGLLAPGIYKIRVAAQGFEAKEVLQRLFVKKTGEVVPVPVQLDPAGAVSATAAVPPLTEADTDIRARINTSDGQRGDSFTEAEVVSIPLSETTSVRSFDDLATLSPGVAAPPQAIGNVAGPGVGAGVGSAGQFSVNGLRSRANNFTVDGSDNNDEDIGVRRQGFVALIPQPIESIEEYQITTLLAPAQFGRNLGAQVNAVSKSGGSETHGTIYGSFSSSQLSARNFFDTTFGNGVSTVRANNRDVLVQTRALNGAVTSEQPLTVRNQSGGEDSFTFWDAGVVLGGPIIKQRVFYFVSLERAETNATEENSFAVPTIEQRGAFRTGATGIFQDPFNGQPTATIPAGRNGSGIFSLYPFPNNPAGVFGPNTFTQALPASGRGTVLSGKGDYKFKIKEREQSTTGRYNFTNDWRNIPVTGDALFSTLMPRIRTQNFSFFFNSQLSHPDASTSMFNQLRLSYGRTKLRFDEVRDTQFLIPSGRFPAIPFLLNAPELINVTTPISPGVPNTSAVVYVRQPLTTEQELGPLGQVVVAGFSPIGVDVNNFPQERVNNTYQVADNLTMRRGDHSFVFGVDTRRSELNSNLPRNARPLVTFNGAPRLVFENGTFRFPVSSDANQFIRGEDLVALGAASNFYLTLNTAGNDARISLRYYQLNFFGQDDWQVRPGLSLSYGLRYEYNTPVRELNRRIENTFDDPNFALAPGLAQFLEGRTEIYDPDRNNLAPRIGLAYSPKWFGREHLTVIRGGYGLFYDQILGAVVSQSRNVFPTFLTLNFGGLNAGANETTLSFFNPGRTIVTNSAGVTLPLAVPNTLNQINPDLPLSRLFELVNRSFPSALSATLPSRQLLTPMAHHYDFVIEQQLGMNAVVSVGYVGTLGRNLLRFTTPNLGPASTLAPTSFAIFQEEFDVPQVRGRVRPPSRLVAGVGGVNRFETTASSRYDSLQIQLRARLAHSLQWQATYTLSKATDDVSDVFDLAGAPALPQNSLTLAGERGTANFDNRHRWSYYLIYDFPKSSGKKLRFLTDGLQLSSTGRYSSGQPFTVGTVFDVNLDGNLTDRLNTTNGLVTTGDRRQPLQLTVDPRLLLAPVGQDGAVVRNTFRAGSILELDLSVRKKIALSGNKSLTLRADIFNLPGRTNFGIPVRFLEAPGFGQATKTVTTPRKLQMGLQVSF